MFGKFFASAFTGSMFGSGADVFAIWGYVIANTVASQVELNPRLLAAAIGMSTERAQAAIDTLCKPDPGSRSKNDEGMRLVREGEYAYRVPNHDKYRAIRCEEDRRAYNREAQRRHREKKEKSTGVNNPVIDSQSLSSVSAQAEAEAYTEKKEQEPRAREIENEPSAAALACKAIIAAGILANPSHPELLAAIAEGTTTQEFADAAVECKSKGKGFAYLLAMIRRRKAEAAAPVARVPKPLALQTYVPDAPKLNPEQRAAAAQKVSDVLKNLGMGV